MPASSNTFEIKGSSIPLLTLHLRSCNLDAVATEMRAQYGEGGGFFDRDLLLIDLSEISSSGNANIDFSRLCTLLRQHGLIAIAARGGTPELMDAAAFAGLPAAPQDIIPTRAAAAPAPQEQVASKSPSTQPDEVPSAGAMFITMPLRSGQQAYARGRDLVITAMVNAGAEVIADGHIHVYAPLRGRAIAGAQGWKHARIFAQEMRPELVSIAGVWRTCEEPLPKNIFGKPAALRLDSDAMGDRLVFEPLCG
ncbi:MAG: septum site-determining protein MinC [Ottowia sp.]|nr:septum site-determining protein MinC [Ottowia sp.]